VRTPKASQKSAGFLIGDCIDDIHVLEILESPLRTGDLFRLHIVRVRASKGPGLTEKGLPDIA
jgi:hypothetical protein